MQQVNKDQLLPLILLAFKSDDNLVNYHISPGTPEHMAEHTYGHIMDGNHEPLYIYAIEVDGRAVGFTVLTNVPYEYMLSFGINKLYRNDVVKKRWLELVKELFRGEKFAVPLYTKNTRAIKFFQDNGFNNCDNHEKFVLLWQ